MGHNHTHLKQFKDSNLSTMQVSGLSEETGVPGGGPEIPGEHANFPHMTEMGIKPKTLEE